MTLRTRLTVFYTLVFGVLLTALGGLSYRVLAQQLDSDATANLIEMTNGLHGYLRLRQRQARSGVRHLRPAGGRLRPARDALLPDLRRRHGSPPGAVGRARAARADVHADRGAVVPRSAETARHPDRLRTDPPDQQRDSRQRRRQLSAAGRHVARRDGQRAEPLPAAAALDRAGGAASPPWSRAGRWRPWRWRRSCASRPPRGRSTR